MLWCVLKNKHGGMHLHFSVGPISKMLPGEAFKMVIFSTYLLIFFKLITGAIIQATPDTLTVYEFCI